MEVQMDVLIEQMKVLASLLFMGYFARRIGLLKDDNIDHFSAILTKLIIPAMLITMIPNGGTRAELFGMWQFFLCTVAMLSFAIFVGFLVSRVIGLKHPVNNLHIAVTAFGNGGFLGIPILVVMYPETAGLAGAVFILVEATICWVVGPLLADSSEGSKKVDFKKLVSPLTISIILGFSMVLLNLDFKGTVFWDTLTTVGGTTKYFATIYLGLVLGRTGLKKLFLSPKVLFSTPFKLVFFPLFAYFLLGKLGILEGNYLIMLVFLLATPTGMAVPLLASMGNNNQEYAMAGTMINTLLCLLTIPGVMWIVLNF